MFIMLNIRILILCGGLSTKKIPKSLIKFKKKPFIFYQLDWIKKNNIKNVILLTGHLEHQIKRSLKNSYNDLNIIYIKDGKRPRGTAGAVINAKKYLNDFFILINGDTYPLIDAKRLVKKFIKNKKKSTVVIKKNDKKNLQSNIKIKNKNIIFYEKVLNSDAKYIDYGLQIFNKKEFFSVVQTKHYQMMDEIYLKLIKKRKLLFFKTNKKFFEIGSYKGIKDFKKLKKK